jgi:hypothetical protein
VVEERYRSLPRYRENVNFPIPASCALPQLGSEQTIGFAGLGILPTAHLVAAGSFDKSRVGHTANNIAHRISIYVTAIYPRTWATNYREPNAAGQGADGDGPGGEYRIGPVSGASPLSFAREAGGAEDWLWSSGHHDRFDRLWWSWCQCRRQSGGGLLLRRLPRWIGDQRCAGIRR